MHRRRPASGHGDQIDRMANASARDAALVDVERSQRATADPMRAPHLRNGSGQLHLDARSAGPGQQWLTGAFAQVGEHNLGARPSQRDGIQIGRVVIGCEHRLPSGHNPVSVDIGANRTRQHHTGPVIAGKHQRPFDGATGHDDAGSANHMQPLPRDTSTGIRPTRRRALDHAHRAAVIQAKSRRTGQDTHLAGGGDIRQHLRQPAVLWTANRLAQHRAAQFKILLDQGHLHAGAGGAQRRAQAGRSGTDHQQIGKTVVPVVAVGIRRLRSGSETSGAADEIFVEHPRLARRPHEGLVVKTGDKNRRQQGIDRHQVEAHRRPGVLGVGRQTVMGFQRGGRDIGFARVALSHRQQRIGFLHARRQDAAWSVVLERTRHQVNAMREQGGCDGVASVSAE